MVNHSYQLLEKYVYEDTFLREFEQCVLVDYFGIHNLEKLNLSSTEDVMNYLTTIFGVYIGFIKILGVPAINFHLAMTNGNLDNFIHSSFSKYKSLNKIKKWKYYDDFVKMDVKLQCL